MVDTFAPVIEAVKKDGILIDECVPGSGSGETVSFRPAMASTDPKEIGVVDILIVFVRYMFLEAACRNALPMIGPDTVVVTLQNGIGNYDEIAKVVPEDQIVIGNTAFGSTGLAPGHVKHTGTGTTFMGTLAAPIEKAEKAAAALREAGFEVVVKENVMEALDVAIASGCRFDREAELAHAYEIAVATGTNRSSTLQDVTHQKETEIRIINGAVSRIGRQYGIPTPYNDMICQLMLAKQSIYLGR